MTDRAKRRTARLLSAILLLLAPLAVISTGLQVLDSGAIEPRHLALVGAVFVITLLYVVSRTEHFLLSADVTALLPTVVGLIVVRADATDPGWFAFMALSPALASLLLPMRSAVLISVANLVAVGVAAAVATDLETDTAIVAIMFNAIMSVILLTAKNHRNELERDRRAELEARQGLNERILEGTFGGIVVHKLGQIVQANETFGEMFGVPTADLEGKHLSELVHLSSLGALEEAIDLGDGTVLEVSALRPDLSTFDAEALALAPTEVGAGGAAIFALRDISESKRARDALVQAQRMESVGRMAAGIAHDTNDLLAVISIYAEKLRRERYQAGLSTDGERIIQDATQQIASLLGRMLLAGRGRVGEPVTVDLARCITSQEPLWRQVLPERIELRIRRGGGLSGTLIDRSSLEQVLLNLVLNGRDAMPGQGRLEIEADRLILDWPIPRWASGIPAGPYQHITVTDTGTGIAPADLDHVFEPFFTTKDVGIGTGIGLYTSREVVEEAGGLLTVETSERGATFRLLLPESDVVTSAPTSMPETHPGIGEKRLVLVVDDAEVFRTSLVQTLRSLGYDALEANNAEEALELLSTHGADIDAVLTDLTMPGMSGRELLERVHRSWPATRRLAMSGRSGGAVTGAEATLQKPFTSQDLERVLTHVG